MHTQTTKAIKIDVPNEILLSLKQTEEEFEKTAKLYLAIKLYEQNKISSGNAAKLCNLSRVDFLLKLSDFNISFFDEESVEDLENA